MSPPCRPCSAVLLAAVLAAAALPATGAGTAAAAAFTAGRGGHAAAAGREGASLRGVTQLAEGEVTTPPPDASGTTPPRNPSGTTPPPPPKTSDTSVTKTLEDISGLLHDAIRAKQCQCFVALAALVVGLILVISGQHAYKGLVIAFVAAVAFLMTLHFVVSVWALREKTIAVWIVAGEAAAVAAFSTWKGFEGVEALVGVGLGMIVAYRFQLALVVDGVQGMDHSVIVALYTVVVVMLLVTFQREGHLRVLAFMCPIIGAAMTTSALAWGTTSLATHGYLSFMSKALPQLSPVGAPWISFFLQIFRVTGKDVGVFADSPYNLKAEALATDRLCCWTLWLILVIVGWKVQKPFRKSRSTPAASRELAQALLEPDE